MLVAKAEYNYYPSEIEKQSPKKVVKVKKVRKLNKNMYIMTAIILFFTSLFVLSRYAKITEVRLEVTKMEKEVEELKKLRQNLEGELESLKSTTEISDSAMIHLGMTYPRDGQIVYVSVDDSNEIEYNNESFTAKIKDALSSIAGLF